MQTYIRKSFFSAAGVLIYITAVAWLMNHGESIFGKQSQTFIVPVFLLLLFVLSAAVTSYLVLAQPIMVYLGGDKKGAVRLLFSILGWLAVFLIVITLIVFLVR